MTARRGPIVIDTDVFSANLSDTTLISVYEPIIVSRPAFLSFQTVAELRYGALRRGWGTARVEKLDAKIATAEVVHSGDELVAVYAQLRADCVRLGHALGQREHDDGPATTRRRRATATVEPGAGAGIEGEVPTRLQGLGAEDERIVLLDTAPAGPQLDEHSGQASWGSWRAGFIRIPDRPPDRTPRESLPPGSTTRSARPATGRAAG